MRSLRFLAFLPFFLLTTLPAFAATFSDVPDSYRFRSEIYLLVDKGIVNGYPDGTFQPNRPVNRAEMLKMLYKADGYEPSEPQTQCFGDVVAGHWAERFICAAKHSGYVQGVGDGTFAPERFVTKAEGIKMLLKVFEFDMSLAALRDFAPPSFEDVQPADWSYNYIAAAYAKHILPIGDEDARFFEPDAPLTRGEAAVLISGALRAQMVELEEKSVVPSSASSASVVPPASSASSASTSSVPSSASSQKTAGAPSYSPALSKTVGFPFVENQKFSGKKPVAYRFELKAKTTVDIAVALQNPGNVLCRLYRLEKNGFATEYYLGYQETKNCWLLNTLLPGTYQLQLQPTVDSPSFSVIAQAGAGDGNDGFSQAAELTSRLSGELGALDLQDFFRFSVPRTKTGEQTMTVSVTSDKTVACFIYPLDNVELSSFAQPECNKPFSYPYGSYMVAVSHDATASPRAVKQTYTIELSK